MKLMNVLNGEVAVPPPVWLMRQAGRYLPEYRALRAKAGDFVSLCMNPEMAAEVTLQPVRRFGFDAAILFSDILILPMVLGQDLRFAEGEGPLLPPLADVAAVERLDLGRAMQGMAPVIETVRRVRAELAPDAALIGFAGGPFTVACYMLDGKGGGEFGRTRAIAYENPALLEAVIELLVQATIGYLTAQLEAGADCVMLFESWAGILPAAQFRKYVMEPNRRIVEALREVRGDVKIIGFARLAGLMLGEYARATKVDAVGLDSVTDIAAARAACPPGMVLQGNLDPLLLRGGEAAMRAGVRQVLRDMRGQPHIFNLGHGITPDVNPDMVAALLDEIRATSIAA